MNLSLSSVLVTGGAGFIGSTLVKTLVGAGHTVRVIDNFLTSDRTLLKPVLGRIELIEGDLREPAVARKGCAGVDYVFHFAALPSIPLSLERPDESVAHGALTTLNLLTAMRGSTVKRLVFSSSSAVYGVYDGAPARESSPIQLLNPYAGAKYASEVFMQSYAAAFEVDSVALRYFNVFGPGQPANSHYAAVIPAFISRMMKGQAPTIFGSGKQCRDFVFVQDVVQANLLAAAHPAPLRGRAFNVASGTPTDLLTLVQEINGVLGTALKTHHEPARANDVMFSAADISQAREILGFKPAVSMREGLQQIVAAGVP